MDDWVKAGGEEAWSRKRFLLQTANFSAFAFLGYPLALGELPGPCNRSRPEVYPHSVARRLGNSYGADATDPRRKCDEAMGF